MQTQTRDVLGDQPIEHKPARPMEIIWPKLGRQRLRACIWRGTDPNRTPLLMCNGIGASLELIEPIAAALGEEFEIIAFDVPGAGQSPAPRAPYRLWMMARLMAKLLDYLGYDQVDVLGVSWGGTLAQQFALQYGKRCRRLVLASTAHGMPFMPPKLSVLMKFATPRRYNDTEYRSGIAGEIYGGALRTHPELIKKLRPLYAQTKQISEKGYLFQQLALMGWSSAPWLPLLSQRTLVLAGSDDPIVPLINSKLMARLIRHSELQVYDDGHLYLLTNPEEGARTLSRFLLAA